jgi:WXXGXW repeat (2 copies)
MIAIAGYLAATSCTVDGWVESQPGAVVYSRPVSPGTDFVWIDGDWVWGGGSYVWHEGHWDRPRTGHVWVGGQWQSGGRGYRWHRGHWR